MARLRRAGAGRDVLIGALGAALLAAGCAGPGPRAFPVAPSAVRDEGAGGVRVEYRLPGGRPAGYAEVQEQAGTTTRVLFDEDGDGQFESEAAWPPAIGAEGAGGGAGRDDSTGWKPVPQGDVPHVLLILDSVPFEMVAEFRRQGRFSLFKEPSELVSVFPSMTDPALAEFFGTSPCVAVESNYYDGRRLVEGNSSYLDERNAPWVRHVDFRLEPRDHAFAYLFPGMWLRGELGRIERALLAEPRDFVAYVVATSCLGSQRGRDGHAYALVEVERFCRSLVAQMHGRVHITLMSDHGHAFAEGRRVRLRDWLGRLGYRVTDRLREPRDVVVPEYGLVSCAAVYTDSPGAVAGDVVNLSGVELACYRRARDGGESSGGAEEIRVISRAGRGRVVLHNGEAVYEGTGAELFEHYPDGAARIWRAFHGLFEHTPDVLVSLQDGCYSGSSDLDAWINMRGVHGNLRADGTLGFIMSTSAQLEPRLGIGEARQRLIEAGLAVGRTGENQAR